MPSLANYAPWDVAKAAAGTALAMLLADLVWLRANSAMYSSSVAAVQRSPLRIRAAWGAVSYALMVLGVVAVAFRAAGEEETPSGAKATSLASAALSGAVLGVVVYGVFNATNAAIFSAYPARMALWDTVWGTFLFAGATTLFAALLGQPA